MTGKNPNKRRCAKPGCRAWAMRGATYCRAHRPDLPPTRRKRNGREGPLEGFYGELFTQEELLDLAGAAARPSLTDEISMLKVLIRRVVAREEDPNILSKVGRAVEQLTKAWRLQRTISGDAAEGLAAAMAQVLDEVSLELGIDL